MATTTTTTRKPTTTTTTTTAPPAGRKLRAFWNPTIPGFNIHPACGRRYNDHGLLIVDESAYGAAGYGSAGYGVGSYMVCPDAAGPFK
jgi:hypothetical protein